MKRQRFARRGALALAASALAVEYGPVTSVPKAEAGGVAVIPICGPLTHHEEFFFDSYDSIKARVSAALDRCSAVVLKFENAPGGDATGFMETSRALRAKAAATGKRLVAFVDGQASSAAYGLACACSEIVTAPTASVGSIGAIGALVDQTALDAAMGLRFAVIKSGAHKADGNPHEPISDSAIAESQAQIDKLAGLFCGLVEETRGVSAATVQGFEARVFIGADAVSAGLADAVGTLDQVLSALAIGESLKPKEAKTMASKYEEALAALSAAAADGTDEEKSAAKKMLATLSAEDGDGKEKDKPEDDPKSKAEGDDPPADEDEDKKKKPDAKAKAQAANVDAAGSIDLAARVLALEAKTDADERARLLATRPDLMKSPAMKAWLGDPKKSSIATVRNAVKAIEKPQTPPAAAANAVTPAATRGAANPLEGLSEREKALCAEKKIDPAKYAAKKAAIAANSHRTGA